MPTWAEDEHTVTRSTGEIRVGEEITLDISKRLELLLLASGFEVDLEPMAAEEIAAMNADAILALSARLNSEGPVNAVKGGPHTHGNLEALLNIAVGFLICFLAVHRTLKQMISWSFLLGAVAHSGLLYLAIGLNVGWALSLMGTPFAYVGPALILIGLLLAGVAAALGFRGTIEADF